MPISLPPDPTGEQFEDLIVSVLLTLGYFVESNMILSQDGKEILELDVVATPVGEGSSARTLFEVKKESFNFTKTFKLYGQKIYLGINNACLVSMRGASEEHLSVYQAKGNELGVSMCAFPLRNVDITSLREKKNGLQTEKAHSIVAAIWYQNIARRVALSELRKQCKSLHGVASYENAKKYLFTTRASFFQKNALTRAETLYKAYFDNPKLSGSLVSYIAQSKGVGEDSIWEKVRDTHEHLDIQCIMDLESVARFVIVKNALDDAFERGDAPPPSSRIEFAGLSIDIPRHDLPQKYFAGLDRMRKHEHGSKIPYLFEAFYTILGGFLFFEDQEELELLSTITNIPSNSLIECIHFMDDFFGNFFFENKKYKMLCMKSVPAIIRGGGAFVRRDTFGIKEYKEKYGDASWLLGMWHNATYKALEPHLKQYAEKN